MAFNLQGFQFNRGVVTMGAQGQGVTPVIHTYKTTDTKATVAGVEYFPPFVDGDADELFIGDALFIVASDGEVLCMFTSVNPVVLGTDLLAAGTALSVGAPIVAVNDNGARISANILQMQLADATHPGIISENSQTFTGTKAFNDGINVTGPGISVDHLNSSGAIPLPIGDNGLTTFVDITPVTRLTGGINFITGGATIDKVYYATGALSWSDAFAVPQATTYLAIRINNIVTLTVKSISSAAANAAAAPATSGVVLPAAFRPLATADGVVYANSNGTVAAAQFLVLSTGSLTVYSTMAGANFANAGNNSIGTISFSYSVA